MKKYTTYTAEDYLNNNMYDSANNTLCLACNSLGCKSEDLVIINSESVEDEVYPMFRWILDEGEVVGTEGFSKYGVMVDSDGSYFNLANLGGTTLFVPKKVFDLKVKNLEA